MVASSSPQQEAVRRHLSAAFTLALLSIGVIFLVWHETLVPEKMTYDSQMIQDIASGRLPVGSDDKSYGNTGALYRFLGLTYQPMVAAVIGFGIYFAELATVTGRLAARPMSLVDRGVLVAATVLGGIFMGQYSKDVMVAILCLVAFLLGRSVWAEAGFVVLALVYAFYFRQYWALIVAIYIGMRLLQGRTRRLWQLLLLCVLGLTVLALVFPVLAHADIQSFRLEANASRVGSEDARTMIMPLLPGSSVAIGAANTVITFFELLVPLPMLAMSATHAVYGLFLMTVWIRFLAGVRRGLRQPGLPAAWGRCVCLALSMVLVQSIFEPDYGSYLRHLTPMLPLMVYVAVVPGLKRRSSNLGE